MGRQGGEREWVFYLRWVRAILLEIQSGTALARVSPTCNDSPGVLIGYGDQTKGIGSRVDVCRLSTLC